jgi:hypothetical protein
MAVQGAGPDFPAHANSKGVRSGGHDKVPDVLGQLALARGGTPDPGSEALAAPEVGERRGHRWFFFLHRL